MSRAFLLLAVLAMICVWVSASPAAEMEKMLNNIQSNLYRSPIQDQLEESEKNSEYRYSDALEATKLGPISFAEQSQGVDAFESMMAAPGPGGSVIGDGSSKNTKKAKTPKSITLVTGEGGKANSQCYACQYYVQRFLGGLLGPFYKSAVAGPPGYPVDRKTMYKPTLTPVSFAEVDAEVDVDMDAEDQVSFLELASQVIALPEAPNAEVAEEQYSKWEPYLSFIDMSNEKISKYDKKRIAEITDKIRNIGRNKKSPRTVKSRKGPMFGKKDYFAAKSFFGRICNRRTPTEYIPVCRTLFHHLPKIVEELNVGDRPDEVCVRLSLCGDDSYLVKRAHSTLRKSDL